MAVVLVVEDDSDLLPVLTDALASEGWMALGARSARAALRIARTRQVDVVLADLLMPGENGLDLESAFRAIPALSRIPFVLMTGSQAEMRKIRRRPVLLKPFEIHEASAVLAASLRRDGSSAGSIQPRP